MNFIDRMFLLWYSKEAVAAVLPAGMVHFAMISFPLGIAAYTNTFVAQYYGAGHLKRIGPAVWQGLHLGFFCVPLYLALIPLAPWIFAAQPPAGPPGGALLPDRPVRRGSGDHRRGDGGVLHRPRRNLGGDAGRFVGLVAEYRARLRLDFRALRPACRWEFRGRPWPRCPRFGGGLPSIRSCWRCPVFAATTSAAAGDSIPRSSGGCCATAARAVCKCSSKLPASPLPVRRRARSRRA